MSRSRSPEQSPSPRAPEPALSLTRDQILKASDLKTEVVRVPEWGGTVNVRTMTGSERDRFEAEFLKDRSKDFRAKLAAFTLCDPSGALLFSEEDIPALAAKSVSALQRVYNVALRLNAVSRDDVSELAGNS